MNQNSVADGKSAKVQASKWANGNASSPLRLRSQCKAKLDALIARINEDRMGRRVKPDDSICHGLDLMTEQHLQEIGTRLLPNKDRIDRRAPRHPDSHCTKEPTKRSTASLVRNRRTNQSLRGNHIALKEGSGRLPRLESKI